jgi:hypothetical protein
MQYLPQYLSPSDEPTDAAQPDEQPGELTMCYPIIEIVSMTTLAEGGPATIGGGTGTWKAHE